jgi:hypothetical protein
MLPKPHSVTQENNGSGLVTHSNKLIKQPIEFLIGDCRE